MNTRTCSFQVTRTSSESITSIPASSASGSPSRVIYVRAPSASRGQQQQPAHANLSLAALPQAKLGDETLDYKDLAALPKTKAIYNIDRPDLLSYSPYVSYPSEERHYAEVSELALSASAGASHWDEDALDANRSR